MVPRGEWSFLISSCCLSLWWPRCWKTLSSASSVWFSRYFYSNIIVYAIAALPALKVITLWYCGKVRQTEFLTLNGVCAYSCILEKEPGFGKNIIYCYGRQKRGWIRITKCSRSTDCNSTKCDSCSCGTWNDERRWEATCKETFGRKCNRWRWPYSQ